MMTNKERYKQAFSALHTSGKLYMEVEKMAEIQKKHKKNIAAAAAIVCAIVLGSSGTAYAADIGGIQEKVFVWLYGTKTETEIAETDDGGYTVRYEHNCEEQGMTVYGGITFDIDGSQKRLSEDELVTALNESATVEEDADGKVWLYYYDQKADITDLFDGKGICRVAMTYEGQVRYFEFERKGNGCYSYSQADDLTKEEIEKYINISSKVSE